MAALTPSGARDWDVLDDVRAENDGPHRLDETERKIFALLSEMTPEEKNRMRQLIEAGLNLARPPRQHASSSEEA